MMVKIYLNYQGGTESNFLVKEVSLLPHWAEEHLLLLKAVHLQYTAKITANWLSCQ